MAYKNNRELEGTAIGMKIRLNAPVRVLKGEFAAGSLLEVVGDPDNRGEFKCRDLDSGEMVYITPVLCSYSKA